MFIFLEEKEKIEKDRNRASLPLHQPWLRQLQFSRPTGMRMAELPQLPCGSYVHLRTLIHMHTDSTDTHTLFMFRYVFDCVVFVE